MKDDTRLIYFAPLEQGGLLDYATEQLLELERLGQEITCVASKALAMRLASMQSSIRVVELPDKKIGSSKLGRAWAMASHSYSSVSVLASEITKSGIARVLIAAFAEYFAPLWSNKLVKLKENGTRFGVVVHDPVRDFQLGPKWWHRRSIRAAYSFIDVAFVHEPTELQTYNARRPEVCVIPHGIYKFPLPEVPPDRSQLRRKFDLPADANVGLSFGHIRDGKNLDLVIRAMRDLPYLHLVVAGRPQSSSQRQVEFYHQLSREVAVAERCHWFTEFIPAKNVWEYFSVSDFLILLYSSDFRSASGVLSAASQFEKPVLASGGDGPLKNQIEQFQLGLWVNPDCLANARNGLKAMHKPHAKAKWNEYRQANSWTENSNIILKSL